MKMLVSVLAAGAVVWVLALLGALSVAGIIVPQESPAAAPVAESVQTMPVHDVPGDDIDSLPRPPTAVRVEFAEDVEAGQSVTEVEYIADLPVDSARNYYRSMFGRRGWAVESVTYRFGEWVYVVRSGTAEAVVEIEPSVDLVEVEVELRAPRGALTRTR